MQQSGIPSKFALPFANSAGAGYIRTIPTASQIGTNPGYASLTDGFPPLCFLPIAAGGVPISGLDLNGILNEITAWEQWNQASGPVFFDPTFAAEINGYPKNAVVASIANGFWWINGTDNNLANPDANGANWIGTSLGASFCGTTSGSVGSQQLSGSAVPFGKFIAGQMLSFIVGAGLTNNGPVNLTLGTLGTFPVRRDGQSGPIALTGLPPELVAGNFATCWFDGVYVHLVGVPTGTGSQSNASGNTGVVASVSGSGSITIGHIAVFSDTKGTVSDGGAAPTSSGYVTVTTSQTVGAGIYLVDTSGGAITLTLNLTGTGTYVFIDPTNSWGANNLTINGNGLNIGPNASVTASTFVANVSDCQFTIQGETTYWRLV